MRKPLRWGLLVALVVIPPFLLAVLQAVVHPGYPERICTQVFWMLNGAAIFKLVRGMRENR